MLIGKRYTKGTNVFYTRGDHLFGKMIVIVAAILIPHYLNAQQPEDSKISTKASGVSSASTREMASTVLSASDPHRMLQLFPEEEDWSFLADVNQRVDPLDKLKYIPIGRNGAYVSFGGEGRGFFESINNESFGLIDGDNSYPELRLLFHADIHYSSHIRFFMETQSGGVFGRRTGPRPTIDEDDFDLLSGFFEWKTTKSDDDLRGPRFTARVGRQQLDFGAGRLVSAREGPLGEGPNILQAFDGVRLIERTGPWRVDAFAAKPNEEKTGVLDDGWLHGQALWGVYASHGGLLGSPSPDVEAYYIGTKRPGAPFYAGVADETRHTVGLHAFRSNTPLSYDAESIFQFGSFGQRNIRAWSLVGSAGYIFHKVPLSPQPSLLLAVTSGGSSARTLATFYAPFPRGVYFGSLSAIGPENISGMQGSVTLHPAWTFTVNAGIYAFWRKSESDGLYALPGFPELPPTNNNRAVGVQPIVVATWVLSPHLSMHAEYERFQRGEFIRAIPGTNSIDYGLLSGIYRF